MDVLENVRERERRPEVGAVPSQRLVDPEALVTDVKKAQERRDQRGGGQVPGDGRIAGERKSGKFGVGPREGAQGWARRGSRQ